MGRKFLKRLSKKRQQKETSENCKNIDKNKEIFNN